MRSLYVLDPPGRRVKFHINTPAAIGGEAHLRWLAGLPRRLARLDASSTSAEARLARVVVSAWRCISQTGQRRKSVVWLSLSYTTPWDTAHLVRNRGSIFKSIAGLFLCALLQTSPNNEVVEFRFYFVQTA
jgi:hypothetical protein